MKIIHTGRLLFITLVFVSLAFTGCAATSLLYNHADWLIARQINGYFDLNRSQKMFLSSRLNGILTNIVVKRCLAINRRCARPKNASRTGSLRTTLIGRLANTIN